MGTLLTKPFLLCKNKRPPFASSTDSRQQVYKTTMESRRSRRWTLISSSMECIRYEFSTRILKIDQNTYTYTRCPSGRTNFGGAAAAAAANNIALPAQAQQCPVTEKGVQECRRYTTVRTISSSLLGHCELFF